MSRWIVHWNSDIMWSCWIPNMEVLEHFVTCSLLPTTPQENCLSTYWYVLVVQFGGDSYHCWCLVYPGGQANESMNAEHTFSAPMQWQAVIQDPSCLRFTVSPYSTFHWAPVLTPQQLVMGRWEHHPVFNIFIRYVHVHMTTSNAYLALIAGYCHI